MTARNLEVTETVADSLARSLVRSYSKLRLRLSSSLGSRDLAEEALHDLWIRLKSGVDVKAVSNHDGYLYRAALHRAFNLSQSNARHGRSSSLVEALDCADESPSAERHAIARDELERLQSVVDKMPYRQKDVFLRTFADGLSPAELAAKHRVTVRTIQMDLRAALLLILSLKAFRRDSG